MCRHSTVWWVPKNSSKHNAALSSPFWKLLYVKLWFLYYRIQLQPTPVFPSASSWDWGTPRKNSMTSDLSSCPAEVRACQLAFFNFCHVQGDFVLRCNYLVFYFSVCAQILLMGFPRSWSQRVWLMGGTWSLVSKRYSTAWLDSKHKAFHSCFHRLILREPLPSFCLLFSCCQFAKDCWWSSK